MRTRDFDYTLPDDRIARTPVARGSARLLVLDAADGERHRTVAELPALLRRGDLLVVNDTRVLPARLEAVRTPGGGRVELLLLDGDDPLRWRAMARPAKKLAPGTVLRIGRAVEVVVEARGEDGVCVLRFSKPVLEVLDSHGAVPLPPYLKRAPLPEDRDWYQTVYAAEPGAVAAPTAGLHFTRAMLQALEAAGIEIAAVTLHVGPGTFKPVKTERAEDHRLDAERYLLPEPTADAIERTRLRGGRVVAVGTTVVRCLEAAARAGASPASEPAPARPISSFDPATRSRWWTCSSPTSTCPARRCSCWSPPSPGRSGSSTRTERRSRWATAFYSYGDAMVAARRCDAP